MYIFNYKIMIFLLTLLFVLQIVCFYFIFRNKSKTTPPKKCYTLKPIPKKFEYTDIEPDCKTFYNVLETIKLEKWEAEVKPDYDLYDIIVTSPDGKSKIKARIRLYDKDVKLSIFSTIINNNSIIFPEKVDQDAIIFLWDYIIQYEEDKNKEDEQKLRDKLISINKSLKTLNRSKLLDDILKK